MSAIEVATVCALAGLTDRRCLNTGQARGLLRDGYAIARQNINFARVQCVGGLHPKQRTSSHDAKSAHSRISVKFEQVNNGIMLLFCQTGETVRL